MTRLGSARGALGARSRGRGRGAGGRSRSASRGVDPVAPSGMRLADLGVEAVGGLFARPGRMSLTVVGVVIGLAALVATLGLSRTAGNRIVGRFDELAATEVIASARPGLVGAAAAVLPWDAPERMQRLNGVVAAGSLSSVEVGDTLVRTSPVSDPQRPTEFRLAVKAASAGLFGAVRAELLTGRFPDEGHSRRAERVAVLDPTAASRLGIDRVQPLPAIRIGDHVYLVIGVLAGVARQPELLGAVVIPRARRAATSGWPRRSCWWSRRRSARTR